MKLLLALGLALVQLAVGMPNSDVHFPPPLAEASTGDVSALRWTEGGPCPKDDEACMCNESVRLCNVIRANNGKEPLNVGTMAMLKNAMMWSKTMQTGPFEHQSIRSLVVAPGETCETGLSGENIAQNFVSFSGASDPAAVCMKAWENSPGHFANIISDSHKNTAIGITVEESGKIWCTQTFSRTEAEPTGSEMCKPVGNAPIEPEPTAPPPTLPPTPPPTAPPTAPPTPPPTTEPAPVPEIPMPSMEPEPSDGPVMEPMRLEHDWFMVRKTGVKSSTYVEVCNETECRFCRDEDRTSCYDVSATKHLDSVLTAYNL